MTGFFDHLQKGGAFRLQAKKPQVRKVVQTRPSPIIAQNDPSQLSRSSTKSRSADQKSKPTAKLSRYSSQQRLSPPSRIQKRPSPAQKLSSDDDASDTDVSFEVRKRVRLSASAEPDLNRCLRSVEAFHSEVDPNAFPMVHAAETTSGQKMANKYRYAFEETGKPTRKSSEIVLQYPSALPGERYELVVPREKDDFKPLDDIVQVVDMVSLNYIPEAHADEFNNEMTGIKRRIRRALVHVSEVEFREVIADYNIALRRLIAKGTIARHLDTTHGLSLPLIERVLTQIYSRTVSPRVESLRQYENGTDNVYGELLPRFISTIFKETKLKSNQVFVDLGSGVGNVVLQAALEIGCESWGCEVMPNACDLANLQRTEFKSRCRLWGIAPGKTHLIRGDFLKQERIIKVLQRADVVLINNQAFTPQLNNELINHFLDMKEGCQIVSLKSFVPVGHKIQSRNLNSPINLLTIKRKNYWSDSVSWTDVGGTYFIATKDSSRLKAFVEKME
ncbi:S-adenosyl-L-methionine-dependent methyltransferase [Elaphomyces granulatus]